MRREALPELAAQLHQVQAELAAQRQLLDEIIAAIGPQLRVLGLLREISAGVGDAEWSASELLEHAREHDSQLHIAIERATGALDANSAKRLGKTFAACADREVGGFRVVRGTQSCDGTWRWSVRCGV